MCERLTEEDAIAAGHLGLSALHEALSPPDRGDVYRIAFHWCGDDPREALRSRERLTSSEIEHVRQVLDALDRPADKPWTRQVLSVIAEVEDIAASAISERLGIEKQRLKRYIRSLKEIGLTESLPRGYRLSPRGKSFAKQVPHATPAAAPLGSAIEGSKPRAEGIDRAFGWMRAIMRELDLPGTAEGVMFGHPCLRVRGKSFIGSKDGRALVVHCPIEEKEVLLQAAPDVYFETDHYRGYPAILVRPQRITRTELGLRIERGWRMGASRKQVAEYEARKARPTGSSR
jgi:biotin operon repressor